jgi:hypothetical protein
VLIEKLFVEALYEERFFGAAADLVTDHEFRKLHAIDQNNPFAEKFRRFARRLGKRRRCNE